MRALLCIVMALLFFSPVSPAQAQTNSPADALQIPAEFKGFFDDYAALAKKYPDAASRFGTFDRKFPTTSRTESSASMLRSASCTGGSSCCTKWVHEPAPRCVQCTQCLP